MKVMCVNLGGTSLLPADINAGNTRSSEFHIVVGREYIVFGILFVDNVISYLIEDEDDLPNWYPASLFDVSDGRLSQYWRFANWMSTGSYCGAISFPEVVQDRESFERLALGDDDARVRFFQRKPSIVAEFSNEVDE